MPCTPPPVGHQFKPTEEGFYQKAGPDYRYWFRIYRCQCGAEYGKQEGNGEKNR
jgi:hypothetical protein